MQQKNLVMTDALYDYLRSVALREPAVAQRLRAETARLPMAIMQIPPEQGQFMALLVRLIGAKRCLEIGTFTGYSALAVAQALPADGRLICCDISEEWTAIARRYWQEAGVADKIDLRLAPAQETLSALIAGGEAGTFDFVFIDADKTGYDAYYEAALTLLRPGGLIVLDNMFMGGRVADPTAAGDGVEAVRRLNAKLRDDPRVEIAMLPLADGVTLAMKR
ncbi:MAG: class I SAM-dependent methyltransferase [Chloroflexota bacterium]|nr:class I SAM-dependent methyltransferase [Dehalococcoidia bacterium]MDW8253770.1 class I SAM-dependent methyltransferase [Chloroflexota bacterium]